MMQLGSLQLFGQRGRGSRQPVQSGIRGPANRNARIPRAVMSCRDSLEEIMILRSCNDRMFVIDTTELHLSSVLHW